MGTKGKVTTMLLIMVGVLTFAAVARAADDGAPRIAKEEVKPLLGDPGIVILDARIGSAWEESDRKIKGAVRVDPRDVGSWAKSLPKNKMIVVYCS